MSPFHCLLTVSCSLAFTASVFAAPNRSLTPRGSGASGIEGAVVQVHHDPALGNAGWIKLQGGRGQPLTFAVNAATRFQRLGQRGRGNSLTTLRTLHRGERVRVLPAPGLNGVAGVVEIVSRGHNRSGNRYVSGYHHRRRHHRRHFSSGAPQVHRRVAVPAVRRNIKPIVKQQVRMHRPAPVNRRSAAGHSRPSAHHRR